MNHAAHALLQMATQIVASLLALETLDDEADIKMYINSPGLDAQRSSVQCLYVL